MIILKKRGLTMKKADKCLREDMMKMINYPILLLIFSFCFLGCATNNKPTQSSAPAQGGRRFYEESGGFSIIPPARWQIAEELPVLQYKSLRVQLGDGYTSVITFSTDVFNGQINSFVDYSSEYLKNIFDVNIIQRSNFVTLKNVRGEKIVALVSMYGENTRRFIYYLPGKDNVFMVINCTVSAETKYNHDEIFDRMAKTFEWVHNDPAQEERRFYEKSGDFSIIPPETWQIERLPDLKYSILRKQGDVIGFEIDTFNVKGNMPINKYVDFVLEKLSKMHGEKFSLIQRNDFVTLKNLKGEKTIIDMPGNGLLIRQFMYYLPGKNNTFMVIMCATRTDTSHTYNELFDKTAETFEWTYPSN